MNLLGCDIEYFKKWIEYQFNDGMNWSNHGKMWHIDHVKPCASYDLTQESQQRECFHWMNMRPLEKRENLSKGDTVDKILIARHQCIAGEFKQKHKN
jgi:hypothetical protein